MTIETFANSLGDGFRLREARTAGDLEALLFFGNRFGDREALAREFPNLEWITIRQTHSDILIRSPDAPPTTAPLKEQPLPAPEADAHWTQDLGTALGVRTADCVPVLIVNLHAPFIASIHAGWRGVENQIIVKSLASLAARGFDMQHTWAFIGPHIGVDSFEVGLDVAARLEAVYQLASRGSAGSPATSVRPHPDASKARVDLLQIVRAQLRSASIPQTQVREHVVDTVASLQHESFRRDRERSGRQISFVALLRVEE